MKNKLKKALLLVAAGSVIVTTTGCNEQDVATGVIIGGIIGGIAAGGGLTIGTGSTGYTFLSDCEGYRREWICEYYNGQWYRTQHRSYTQPPPYYPPTPGYPPHPPRRPYTVGIESMALVTDSDAAATSPVDLKAQEISKNFALNEKASLKLSHAIENAKGGNMKAFDSVGLDLQALNKLLSKNQIDINDLNTFADKLDTNEQTALNILNSFTREYAQQRTDVTSALWRQCQATGRWKTPESSSCSSLDAKGCAPSTGASNCLPQ